MSDGKIPAQEMVRRIHAIDTQLGHGRRMNMIEVDRLLRENPYVDPGGDAFDSLPESERRPLLNFFLGGLLKSIFKAGYSKGRLDGVKSALEMSDEDTEQAIAIASEMRVHAHLIEGWDKPKQ